MERDVIEEDFIYHERTIENMLKGYYQKRLLFLGMILVVGSPVFYYIDQKRMVILFWLLLLIGISLIVKRYMEIPQLIEQEREHAKLTVLAEDTTHYYVPEENLKFSKKKSRNLMSRKLGFIFFIGLNSLDMTHPVTIRYYEVSDMQYTDKYRLKQKKISFSKSKWKYRLKSWWFLLIIPLIAVFMVYGYPYLEDLLALKLSHDLTGISPIPKKPLSKEEMEKEKVIFWTAIDRSKEKDPDKFIEKMTQTVEELTASEQAIFQNYLNAYLYISSYSIGINMANTVINGEEYIEKDAGGLSMWLISQGEAVFMKSLEEPDSLADNPDIVFGQTKIDYSDGHFINLSLEESVEFNRVVTSFQSYQTGKDGQPLFSSSEVEKLFSMTSPVYQAQVLKTVPKLIERADREGFA